MMGGSQNEAKGIKYLNNSRQTTTNRSGH